MQKRVVMLVGIINATFKRGNIPHGEPSQIEIINDWKS